MWMKAIRGALRLVLWSGGALLALLAALFLAWLPFNLRDAEPRPLPAELQPPASRIADARNAAYAVEGALAEAGRDPAVTGRAMWDIQRAWAALPPAQRASEAEARGAKIKALMGKTIAAPKNAPWICEGKRANCDADWLAQVEALEKQRTALAVLGERCDKLLEGPFEFEELLPPGRGVDAPLMSWQPMSECSRWFRSGALVALARGQRDQALADLKRADRQHRQLWEGSRTLIGHMVATRLARSTYDTLAAAALREPTLAEAMAPWLEGPLDTRAGARRWVTFEANYQRGLVDELRSASGAMLSMSDGALSGFGVGPGAPIVDWMSSHGIGFHAERTKQKLDDAWLREVGRLQGDWPAIIAGAAAERRERQQRERGFWDQVNWRNTFGEGLIDVAASNSYSNYFVRHADHELHREATALVLALQRQRVPAAQRAEVAKKAPGLSNTLKERMGWSADGKTLTVRPMQSDTPGATYDPRRDAITFIWPQ